MRARRRSTRSARRSRLSSARRSCARRTRASSSGALTSSSRTSSRSGRRSGCSVWISGLGRPAGGGTVTTGDGAVARAMTGGGVASAADSRDTGMCALAWRRRISRAAAVRTAGAGRRGRTSVAPAAMAAARATAMPTIAPGSGSRGGRLTAAGPGRRRAASAGRNGRAGAGAAPSFPAASCSRNGRSISGFGKGWASAASVSKP